MPDNNFSLSIPLYVRSSAKGADGEVRSVKEHYDGWLAASEGMRAEYAKLNALLDKESGTDE